VAQAVPAELVATPTVPVGFGDTQPGSDAAGDSENRGERGRRRRRRGGRERDETGTTDAALETTADAIDTQAPVADAPALVESQSEAASAAPEAPSADDGGERDGRRRGGRGRQRREPRELEPGSDAALIESAPEAAEPVAALAEPAPAEAAAPVVAVAPAAPVAAPSVPTPKLAEPFVLDADQLRAVAEAAGLQWVGSDAAKIQAAQEAMAREPKPVHVPREIKPVVLLDEGPLVLVETRKDLAQYKLPFETSASA
jgi:ribonuclease E